MGGKGYLKIVLRRTGSTYQYMKLNREQESDLLTAYNRWWESYISGDLDIYDSYFDDDYHFVGSTDGEEYLDRKGTTAFLQATADQLAGKVELRNLHRNMDYLESRLVLITDLADAYVLSEGEWVYYSRFRFSSLMRHTDKGWRFVYQHFSAPDIKAQDGESLGLEKISKENLELRDAIKRRTKELEQKNAELAIEAALERVRAKTMAMHSSTQLAETALVLYREFALLGDIPDRMGIVIFREESNELELWPTDQMGSQLDQRYTGSLDGSPVTRKMYDAWKSGEDSLVVDLKGQALKQWLHYVRNELKLYVDRSHIKGRRVQQAAFFSHGTLLLTTNKPVADRILQLLIRFAKVFSQTYTRFLDLQKAEEQAREAKIEVALEKVRSRSMAMQKSDDFKDVIQMIYDQFVHLNIHVEHTGFIVDYKANKDMHIWLADLHNIPSQITFPYFDCAYWNSFKEAREKGLDFFSNKLDFEEKNTFYRDLFELLPGLPDEAVRSYFEAPGLAISTVLLDNLGLYIENFDGRPYTEEENNILMRFGKVFQQTYTRFNDLQKAEAQAREAQIEAALEKVRAASMAMHNSNELSKVITILGEQLHQLGIEMDAAILNEKVEGSRDWHMWLAIPSGSKELYTRVEQVHVPYKRIAAFDRIYRATSQGLSIFSDYHSKPQKDLFFKHYFKNSNHRDVPKARQDYIFSCPGLSRTTILSKNSFIQYFRYSQEAFSAEEKQVLERFGHVFEQSYTRFLDLQKAEAQAREAQIEAALERVRTKTMAMHNSQDVGETVLTLFDEVLKLGLDKSIRCGIGILEGTGKMETWSATYNPDGEVELVMGLLDMTIHPLLVGTANAWKNKESSYSFELSGREVKKYYTLLNNEPEYPFNVDLNTLPGRQYTRSFFFAEGILFSFANNPLTEEAAGVLSRFAGVFGQTYRRYLDLKKAEEQAAAAIKQASLDRVRGEISGMRSAADLERITPLVWRELTTLGVPFFRCGVFIVDDIEKHVNIYLSAPDGHSIGAMQFAFDANTLTSNLVAYWRQGNIYREHWNRQDFISWTHDLKTQNQIQDEKIYQDAETPPASLHLHFIPFKQGMLYVGNSDALDTGAITLVQSLAVAFEMAYARYDDFNRLEKAKAGIEAALSELKATQTQLIQSEKMASLGELTAGIAHEIQNPLNFVNNFSEVSAELIEEMNAELGKGDLDEARNLAEDIRQNLEKILHHGKRADGIVKGMLLHSRASSGKKELTDINVLCDEYLRLAYHGLRARDKSFNATINTDLDPGTGKVNIVPQEMGRVILNLITNAFYAVTERRNADTSTYKPTVQVSTKRTGENIIISVQDNGKGIPDKIKDKVFQPFFTTKPTGQGTGLGLSLSYDIVKAHGGNLTVSSKKDEGCVFSVKIPLG